MKKSELPGEQGGHEREQSRSSARLFFCADRSKTPSARPHPPIRCISAPFRFIITTAGSAADERSEALKKSAETDFLRVWEKLPSSSEGRFGLPEPLLAKTKIAYNTVSHFTTWQAGERWPQMTTFPLRQAMEGRRHFHPCRLTGMYPRPSQKLRFC